MGQGYGVMGSLGAASSANKAVEDHGPDVTGTLHAFNRMVLLEAVIGLD